MKNRNKYSQRLIDQLNQIRAAEESARLKRGNALFEAAARQIIPEEYVYNDGTAPHHVANSVSIVFSTPEGVTQKVDIPPDHTFFIGDSVTDEHGYRGVYTDSDGNIRQVGVSRGKSPTGRRPQLQQTPRNPSIVLAAQASCPQYQELLEAWRKQNQEASRAVQDHLDKVWKDLFDRLAERARCRAVTQAELYAAIHDVQEEPAKQKPYWMQLQDKQQKRQRGRHRKVFTKQR